MFRPRPHRRDRTDPAGRRLKRKFITKCSSSDLLFPARRVARCLSIAPSQTLLGQNVDEIDNLDEVVSDLTLKVTVSLFN